MTWQDDALKHAQELDPYECVGLVVIVKGKETYLRCRNIALDPKETFVLDPDDYVRASDAGEIARVVHSHPHTAPVASEADKLHAEKHALPWNIVNPRTGEWGEYEPCGYKPGLIGREWIWSVQDCWSLVRDYYKEQGLELRDWDRPPSPDEFLKSPMFEGAYAATGFRELTGTESLEKDDLLLMSINSPGLNHCGVFLGSDTVLHHLSGRLSSRDIYSGWLQSCTGKRLRHAA